jgi:hypothetical protein
MRTRTRNLAVRERGRRDIHLWLIKNDLSLAVALWCSGSGPSRPFLCGELRYRRGNFIFVISGPKAEGAARRLLQPTCSALALV